VAVVVDQVIDQAIAPPGLGFTGLSSVEVLAALAVGTKVGTVGIVNCYTSGWLSQEQSR